MKKLSIFLTTVLSYFLLAPSAFAQLNTCPLAPFNVLCFQEGDISDIITALVTFIFITAVVIALFYLLYGAVRWINSGGDKAAIEAARGTIVAAIIGLIILFLMFLFINILLGFFNVNVGEINVPSINTS